MKHRAFGHGNSFCLLITALLATSVIFAPAVASGTNRYVSTTGVNSGDCTSAATPCLTITYAIDLASAGDSVRIAAGTYYEHLAPLKDLNFYGAGMNATIIDGSGTGIVLLSNAYDIAISDLTIHHGYTADSGGGISQYSGSLALTRVKVTGSTANDGGGVYCSGPLTMKDSVVSGNTANNAANSYGGGMFLSGSGSASLTNVTISGNTSASSAGGLHNQISGTLNLTNVTISGNIAKTGSAFTVTNGGVTNILNSTITGNHYSAGGSQGAILLYATIDIKNSIISGNDAPNCFLGTHGSMVSQGHNLDSASTCGFTQPGDLQGKDPALGSLADNGGLTQTHALLRSLPVIDSPAIDAGDDSGCPGADQRGMLRPQGAGCDIGAYEYSSCANKPAHIDSGSYYYLIADAYTHATGGQTIRLQAYEFGEALNFATNKTVTLVGGYDCNYAAIPGAYSSVNGTLTISAGTVTVANLKIK